MLSELSVLNICPTNVAEAFRHHRMGEVIAATSYRSHFLSTRRLPLAFPQGPWATHLLLDGLMTRLFLGKGSAIVCTQREHRTATDCARQCLGGMQFILCSVSSRKSQTIWKPRAVSTPSPGQPEEPVDALLAVKTEPGGIQPRSAPCLSPFPGPVNHSWQVAGKQLQGAAQEATF